MMDTVMINQNLVTELENDCSREAEKMNRRRKANLCDDSIKMRRRRRRRRKSVESSEENDTIDEVITRMSKVASRLDVYLYCLCIAIVSLNVASSSIHCHKITSHTNTALEVGENYMAGMPLQAYKEEEDDQVSRPKRSPVAPSSRALSVASLLPSNELRMSGSKNEPPSRPSVDWSKQRPYFGPDMVRNVSVELGKTAYLTCKVYELGDKTVSWLRPRENEILTAGKFTYIGDPRFASINDNGSHDWILEIKDVGLNDSTSYECQVSTDPKMNTTINLHVKAAKARIKQGELYYAHQGSNIEFTCEIGQKSFIQSSLSSQQQLASNVQQTYWYFNGNLLNYARTHAVEKNFSIDWDPTTQLSRFRLFNIQQSDAGNYTCKPTSSEPATIRLFVKRFNKNPAKDRAYSNGYHSASTKEAQKNRQHFGIESSTNNLELTDSSGSTTSLRTTLSSAWNYVILFDSCLLTTSLLIYHHFHLYLI